MNSVLLVENGEPLAAIRDFLRYLLETEIVAALYLPLETSQGALVPALVTDSDQLNLANPLAPVMPINGARAIAALTGKCAPAVPCRPARLGALLRPCEIRALFELVKLQQATLENVLIIGLDCPGTGEVAEYMEKRRAGPVHLTSPTGEAGNGRQPVEAGLSLRPACRMCLQPVPQGADIQLHLFGADLTGEIPLVLKDEVAAELALPEAPAPETDRRAPVLAQMLAAHQQFRAAELAAMQARLASKAGIAEVFAACLRCHNCMTACPVCYCKTCLFKTAAFDHEPAEYLNAARRKGALRLLGDMLLFHLTRLNHMSASCVSCGMCTSACPVNIPVGTLFSLVAGQVQEVFGYQPGRSLAEPLPLITFQPNEWAAVGEEK